MSQEVLDLLLYGMYFAIAICAIAYFRMRQMERRNLAERAVDKLIERGMKQEEGINDWSLRHG